MTTPAVNTGSAVAGTWVGGMSLDSLVEGIRLNQISSTQQSVDTQRFWSTPSRDATSDTHEVMQLTLGVARGLNQLEFDVAVFPQDLYIEFYDDETKAWSPCLSDQSTIPEPVTYSVRDSIPTVLPPASAVQGHLHPQHSFTGHWRTVTFQIKPVFTKNLRIVLSRTTQGTSPTNTQGLLVPYSLAIRNLNLSYSVRKLSDVPWTNPGTGEQRNTFASTTDLFGSVVNFSVRVNSATNAIGTTKGANALTTVWKCNPQPIPWAVVNFHVDGRDQFGAGQLLDRFYLDPLYDGPTCNLYWSNDVPTADFPAPSDPIPAVIAAVHNSAGVTGNVLDFPSGSAPDDSIAFVELDNRGLQFDPSHPWSVGGQLNFRFSHGTQSFDCPIFDCGAFQLAWTPLGPRLTTGAGDTLLVATQTPGPGYDPTTMLPDPTPPTFIGFDPTTALNFIAWSDGTQIGVAIRFGTIEFSGVLPLSVPFASGSVLTMRVGAFLGASPGAMHARLKALVLKTDSSPDDAGVEDFLANPLPYVLGSTFLGVNDPRTDNALVRYTPALYSADFPAAMVGGSADRYANMSWSPIARDYVVRRGYMYFPPTRAKYWKLEFTNLSPQPYEIYRPVQKKVAVFPSAQWQQAVPDSRLPTSTTGLAELMPGKDNIYVVNTLTQTLDSGRTAVVGTNSTKSNTTARIIYDNDVRNKVGSAYWAWSFLPMHTTGITPSWESTGQHDYEVIDYTHTSKISYFVGLRSIQAYRLNYLNSDDTAEYIEQFYDGTNIDLPHGNWILEQDHLLTSGQASYAEVRSKPFSSNRVVTAVQFATQQSDPIQLTPDSEMADPTMASWDPVGDAVLSDSSGLDPLLHSTKRVDRSQPALTYARVKAGYPTWGSAVAQNATFGIVMAGSQIPAETGGITSKAIAVPGGGRIHAAARVTATKDLTRPLTVQIVDADSGAVLADSPLDVKAGKISEWYSNYTLGGGTDPLPWLWRDFGVGYTSASLNTTFFGANATTLPVMDSGQSWNWPVDQFGSEFSLDVVTNQAQVTSEGQYDYVDTGSPWGTLSVTMGSAMGTSVAGTIALMRLNPLFLTETGYLGNLSGSAAEASRSYVLTTNNTPYTVVAGDVIRVDFLPADYVPSGQVDAGAAATDNYAMMFFVNGVWKCTRNHSYGHSTIKGIKGRFGQRFARFTWTPATYGLLPGPTIATMPRTGSGAWVDTATQQLWQEPNGRQWNVGSSNITTTPVAAWDTTNVAERGTALDTDMTATFSTNKLAVGGAQYMGLVARFSGTNACYIGRAELNTTQTISAKIIKVDSSGTETVISTVATVAGLTHAAGTVFSVRFQVIGTTLQLKVWLTGTAEPGAWTNTVTDATIATAGYFGPYSRLQTTATNAPVTTSWDNVTAVYPGSATVWMNETFTYTATNAWGGAWRLFGGVAADYSVGGASAVVTLPTASAVPHITYTGAVRDDIGACLVAATDNAVIWTDTKVWHGQMTFRLRNIAGTIGSTDPAGRRGNVACLDFDAKIYLDATGNLVQNGVTIQSGVYTGTLPMNKDITIVFTDARYTNPAASTGRAVFFVCERAVVGTVLAANVALMTGTKRGLAGSLLSGTRPLGSNYTQDTAFQSFNWSPNAKLIAQSVSTPTWASVTKNKTLTWGEVRAAKLITPVRVQVRVVQLGQSNDEWDVDNISLYSDPIVWSFSNDGGYTWTPAYEIRNNPSGVLVFPLIAGVNLNQQPGNSLVWKAASYRAGSIVSSLVIRPWYGGLFSGVDHRATLVATSPNVMPFDQYGDIRKDARFQTWSLPIPRDWWYSFRVIQAALETTPAPAITPILPGYPDPSLFYPGTNVYPGVPS
jgi:hypothetical protein